MKLQQFILLSVMFYGASTLHASELTTNMNAAKANLATAQTTLANLMGYSNPNIVLDTNSVSTIKNASTQTVFLMMYDASGKEINPTRILLAPGAFSYIPVQTKSIKVLNYSHTQLIAPKVVAPNTLYTITRNIADLVNPWSLVSSPAIPVTTSYTYKNSTTVPLIVTITTSNSMKENQQILPGAAYNKNINPLSNVAVEAHANISPIYCAYNATASYSITINASNKLELTQTSSTGKTLTNNSGWPMLIRTISPSEVEPTLLTLANKSQSQPSVLTNNVIISPAVINSSSPAAPVKSCNIINASGQLSLQFS